MIVVTEQSRHDDRSWSNASADANICVASSTRDTSQLSSGWLKAAALANMCFMDVTCDTSQPLMSSLKVEESKLREQKAGGQNSASMFVTWDVSHVEMWPYVDAAVAASESHASTAV